MFSVTRSVKKTLSLSFSKFFPLLCISLIFLVLSPLPIIHLIPQLSEMNFNSQTDLTQWFENNIGSLLLSFLGWILLFVAYQNTVFVYLGTAARGMDEGFFGSLIRGFTGIPMMMVVGTLAIIAYMVASIPIFFVAEMLTTTGETGEILANLAFSAWSTLLIIMFMPLPFLVLIDRSGIGSFTQAYKMTQGYRWHILGGLILAYITLLLIIVLLSALIYGGILFVETSLTNTSPGMAFAFIIIAAIPLYSLILFFMISYYAVVYATLMDGDSNPEDTQDDDYDWDELEED